MSEYEASKGSREGLKAIVKDALTGWGEHGNGQMAAALAYYSALTLAPTLLLVLIIAGLFFDRADVAAALLGSLEQVLGAEAVALLSTAIQSLFELRSSTPIAIVGVAALLIGATGLLLQVRVALRRIWGTGPGEGVVRSLVRERIIALLSVGVLAGAVVVLMGTWWAIGLFATARSGSLLQQVATVALAFVLAVAAYRFLAGAPVPWSAAAVGAAVSTAGWVLAALGLGIYFSMVSTPSVYGAASSLVVMLISVYVVASIFLLGAEFARALG